MVASEEGRHRIDRYVERLCQDGCARVREYIMVLESGEQLPQLAELEPAEVEAVLAELITVMSAYQGSCKS